jgi:hypothetical protein
MLLQMAWFPPLFFFFGGACWAVGTLLPEPCLQPFCSTYYRNSDLLFPGLTWTAIILFYASGMTGVHQHAQLFSVEIGPRNWWIWDLLNFFLWLTLLVSAS